jgi:hypothetical protein
MRPIKSLEQFEMVINNRWDTTPESMVNVSPWIS